ncbi:hypothetical protein COM45_04200 [Corynebacterium accolens]|uniref:DUF3800 domain-containing protein n=1 Tax=Corynebacterium accolens TaxID=38284 RepID=A0A2A4ALX8_9CORY|nr:hypothetical protein COM45_04200 [Corynebacterium accolens]
MLKLFIDESYQRDHYYVAGVLVNEKQESILIERLDSLADHAQARNHWEHSPEFRSQRLLCVEGNIHFVDSRTSRGIQAADMAVYILRRHREENHGSKSAARATRRLMKALGPALVHERKWIP